MKHLALSVLLIVVLASFPVHAQTIQQRVSTLEEQLDALKDRLRQAADDAKAAVKQLKQLSAVVDSQSGLIGQLTLQNQVLKDTLGCMSKVGTEVYFTACNVNILSGSGATNGPVNGLGNLIVGYNEDAAMFGGETSDRRGSHSIVVGPGHSYSGAGALIAGAFNNVQGLNSSVTGGSDNRAFGGSASVSGGQYNVAGFGHSSVSGGQRNHANGPWSSISGGLGNSVASDGQNATISGGTSNLAFGLGASVSGGIGNSAYGNGSSISGGWNNTAGLTAVSVGFMSICGGIGNKAYGLASTICGGEGNVVGSFYPISGRAASVSGGLSRAVVGDHDWAAGGLLEDQ